VDVSNSHLEIVGNVTTLTTLSVTNSSLTINGSFSLTNGSLSVQKGDMLVQGSLSITAGVLSVSTGNLIVKENMVFQGTLKFDVTSKIVIEGHLDLSSTTLVVDFKSIKQQGEFDLISFSSSNVNKETLNIQYQNTQELVCQPDLIIKTATISLKVSSECQKSAPLANTTAIIVGVVFGVASLLGVAVVTYMYRKRQRTMRAMKTGYKAEL